MKKNFLLLPLFLPLALFSQKNYKEDTEYLKKNCSQEALTKASKIYEELQNIQMENSFDTTLKRYYEFLESTNCSEFNKILISAWEKDKIINKKSFKHFFLNSKENYNALVNGYLLKKSFRFANIDNLDQGIDDDLQNTMLKYVKSNSQQDFQKL